MSISPNELIRSAGGDLARQTKYEAIITTPITFIPLTNLKNMSILVKNVNLPVMKMETIEYKYKGLNIPIQGVSDYDRTIAITFFLDEKQNLKVDFDNWLAALNDNYLKPSAQAKIANRSALSKDGLTGGLTLVAQNFQDLPTASYNFYNIYPINIGQLEFSSESVSSTMELTVEFAFLTYTSHHNSKLAYLDFVDGLVDDIIDEIFGDADEESIFNSLK